MQYIHTYISDHIESSNEQFIGRIVGVLDQRSPRSLVCTKCKREKYPSSIDTQIFDKSSTMMIISKSVDKYMDVTKEKERFSWSLIFTIPIKCLFEEFYTYFAKI